MPSCSHLQPRMTVHQSCVTQRINLYPKQNPLLHSSFTLPNSWCCPRPCIYIKTSHCSTFESLSALELECNSGAIIRSFLCILRHCSNQNCKWGSWSWKQEEWESVLWYFSSTSLSLPFLSLNVVSLINLNSFHPTCFSIFLFNDVPSLSSQLFQNFKLISRYNYHDLTLWMRLCKAICLLESIYSVMSHNSWSSNKG